MVRLDDIHIALSHGFTVMLACVLFIGPSRSGKTRLAARFLKSMNDIFSNLPIISRALFLYRFPQAIYTEMGEDLKSQFPGIKIQFHQGFLEQELLPGGSFWQDLPQGTSAFILIDDLGSDLGKSDAFELLLKGMEAVYVWMFYTYIWFICG